MAFAFHPSSHRLNSIRSDFFTMQANADTSLFGGGVLDAFKKHGSSPHSSHPDFAHLVLLVFEAVLEVVFVSLPGYILARMGSFDAKQQKFIAEMNTSIFTPALSKSSPFLNRHQPTDLCKFSPSSPPSLPPKSSSISPSYQPYSLCKPPYATVPLKPYQGSSGLRRGPRTLSSPWPSSAIQIRCRFLLSSRSP